MGKLYEVLAAETSRRGAARAVVEEAKTTFSSKAAHFSGSERVYVPFAEEDKATEGFKERTEMVTTVADKLNHVFEHVSKYWDIVLQKDMANQIAVADIVFRGKVIATKVPSVTLLTMEAELKALRDMILAVPTMAPGAKWLSDETLGKGVFRRAEPEEQFRTAKVLMSKIVAPATPQHQAQVEKWSEDRNVGKFIKNSWNGMLTPAEKSRILGNVDDLLVEVLAARQRANEAQVSNSTIAAAFVAAIMG